ncbi:MAG TPA: BadF/BadG/BcrA/BcrD ATPase family protein [Acidisarcina sp.]
MSFYLGLDAGGTSTQCALADEAGIVTRASGGSIKAGRVNPADAAARLAGLLERVSAEASVPLDQIASTCIGIAGLRLPATRPWIEELLGRLVSGKVSVCGDEEIALDAAFPGGAGVLVVAGTGSNAIGRSRSGQMFNVGGWGSCIGDEGSGYWIGRRALNAACNAYDRGSPTQLLDRIIHQWSVEDINGLVAIANGTPAPDFSLLAPMVVEAAAQGDRVATRVLTEAGHLLAESALIAYRKAQAAEEDAEVLDPLLDVPRPCIAFTGSILRHALLVRRSMIDALRGFLPTVHIVKDPVDPVDGAVWRARRALTL